MVLWEIIICCLILGLTIMPTDLNLCAQAETNQTCVPNEIDFIVTLNPSDRTGEVTIVHILNNSGSKKALGRIYVDYYDFHEIIDNPKIDVISELRQENMESNVTPTQEGEFTRISGMIWNIEVNPYEVVFVSLKYRVSDACEYHPKDVKQFYEGYLLKYLSLIHI